jgi:hypothetical protein
METCADVTKKHIFILNGVEFVIVIILTSIFKLNYL